MSNFVSVTDLILSAVVRGDAAQVRNMIGHGASVHARYEHGSTLLHWAARLADDRSCLEVMAALIAGGADTNAQADDGRTPLHVCVEEDNVEGARMLLHFGGDPLLRNGAGRTPVDLLDEGEGADVAAFLFLRHAAQTAASSRPRPRATQDVGGGPTSPCSSQVQAVQGRAVASVDSSTGTSGPQRKSVACRTDRVEPGRSNGRELENLILGLKIGGGNATSASTSTAPAPAVVVQQQPAPEPLRVAQGQPRDQPAWPMMLKFGRNTNPAAASVSAPSTTAPAAAPMTTAAALDAADSVTEEEVGAAELGEAVEALRLAELQGEVRRREGGATGGPGAALGEIHVFQNSKNYLKLELSASEPMSFGFGSGEGGAEEKVQGALVSTCVGPDLTDQQSVPDLSVDFSYDVVSDNGPSVVSKLGTGGAGDGSSESGGVRGVRVTLGPDGRLSDDDFARIRANRS